MKKLVALLLVVALLLAGCSAAQQGSASAAKETEMTELQPTVMTAPTEQTDPTQVTEPTEPTMPTEPEVTDPTEEITEPVVTTEASENTEPPTTEKATEPATAAPTEATKPAATTNPARPTSSATCRDTGSNEIWENPAINQLDYYEETDPERAAYVAEVLAFNNPYYFWIVEESMRMYVGRTYGIVLVTSYDVLMACQWTSSNPEVATVNHVGFVTPLKEGNTVITVSYTDPETQGVTTRVCRVQVEGFPEYTLAELEQMAKEEAKEIADHIMNELPLTSDLERIAAAAAIINQYVADGCSTSAVPGYNQPFGTLITGYSSCAGSTRALGLVLEYMGFEWYHVNENQWDHQWCVVYDVDGQTAFADGSWVGVAGYGSWQTDQPYQYISGVGLTEYTGVTPF